MPTCEHAGCTHLQLRTEVRRLVREAIDRADVVELHLVDSMLFALANEVNAALVEQGERSRS